MAKRNVPEVQAGSMADIAFLLLIFFLITTTVDKDKGLMRQLPSKTIKPPEIDVRQRNILEIVIDQYGDLLIDDALHSIADVHEITRAFIDNGGNPSNEDLYCDYCKGLRNSSSSDHPKKAIVSISTHREAPYDAYIEVQNEVVRAYNTLRNEVAQERYGFLYTQVKKAIDEDTWKKDIDKTKAQLRAIRDLYPMNISEAATKKN